MNNKHLMRDLKITMNPQSKKKYGLMKSLVKKNCRKKECHYDILNEASSI